jgi:DNA-binding beta-propeller fold protein YncE
MPDLSPRLRFSPRTIALAALVAALSAPAFAGPPAPVTYLYWAETGTANSGIWRSLATGELRERLIAPMNALSSVAIDAASGTMFVGTEGDGDATLWRTDLSGGNRVAIVEDSGLIRTIEVDGAAGKVYWSARITGSQSQISRADFDGSSPEPLLTTTLSHALGLDPLGGKMYFGRGFELHRANLDGTGEESLLDASTDVRDIEVDSTQGKLYYSTQSDLNRCELNGTGCKAIGPAAFNLEIVGSVLYYEPFSNGLWQAELDGNNPQLLWDTMLQGSWDIHPDTLEIYEPSANLWRSALDGSNRVGVIGVAGELLHDVAVDPAGARFYFSGEGDESVVQATLDGRTLVPVGGDRGIWSYIRGLDRDPVSGQLFWASLDANSSDGGDDAIGVMNADGSDAQLIVTALGEPHDVAVDGVNGKVYWTDFDGGGSISRADFDGTMVETILPGLGAGIRGIAVDPVNGKVYWTDHATDELWWADLDGADPAALPPVVTNPHDVAVAAAAGYLYWVEGIANSDALTAKIRRSNLDGTGDVDVLTGLPARTRDLTVVDHAPLYVFFDGFESGDTSSWTAATTP